MKVIGRGVVLQLFSTSNLQPTGQLAAQDPTPSEAQPDAAAQAEPDQHRAEPTHAETSAVAPRSLDLATAEATASAACLRLLQAIWQRQHRPPQCAPLPQATWGTTEAPTRWHHLNWDEQTVQVHVPRACTPRCAMQPSEYILGR